MASFVANKTTFEVLKHATWIGVKWSSVTFLFQQYVATFSRGYGPSMHPTFAMDGETLVILRDSFYKQKKYQTGDIIVAKNPFMPKSHIVKRVFATEGEVFLKAPSPQDANQDLYELCQVPKGHIWVEGDFPEMSVDSRIFGAIPVNLVQGSPMKIHGIFNWELVKSDPNYYNEHKKGHSHRITSS